MNSTPFKNYFKSDLRNIHTRITIGDRTFYRDNIYSLDYDSASFNGESFGIGSTYMNSVKIVFSELVEDLQDLDTVIVEIGVERPEFPPEVKKKAITKVGKARVGATYLNVWNAQENIEYATLGKFYLTEEIDLDRNENKTTIQASDSMRFLEEEYKSSLYYPTTIRNVVTEISNRTGVRVDGDSFLKLPNTIVGEIKGHTHREALGMIAQVEGMYVGIDRDDRIVLKSLSDTRYVVGPSEYFSKGLIKNDIKYAIGGIQSINNQNGNEKVFKTGSEKGAQIKLENPIMTQTLLDRMFSKVKGISFYPYSLDWRGMPSLEIGDTLYVSDLKGNRFLVPNLSYKLTYNGGLKAFSAADTKPQSEIVVRGRKTLDQKFNDAYEYIDKSKVDILEEVVNRVEDAKNDKEVLSIELNQKIDDESEKNALDKKDLEEKISDTEQELKENMESTTYMEYIKSKILVADSIIANMIKADEALFDKVFVNDGVFEKLVSEQAFFDTLMAKKFVGTEIEGGTITNPFDTNWQGSRIVGKSTIADALMDISWQSKNEASVVGRTYMHPYGLTSIQGPSDDPANLMDFAAGGITVRKKWNGKLIGGTMSADDYYDTGWLQLTAINGWRFQEANFWGYVRQVGKHLKFKGRIGGKALERGSEIAINLPMEAFLNMNIPTTGIYRLESLNGSGFNTHFAQCAIVNGRLYMHHAVSSTSYYDLGGIMAFSGT